MPLEPHGKTADRKYPFLVRRLVEKHVYDRPRGKARCFELPAAFGPLHVLRLEDYLVADSDGRVVRNEAVIPFTWDTGAYISVLPRNLVESGSWRGEFLPALDDRRRPVYMTLRGGLFPGQKSVGQVGFYLLAFSEIPDRKIPLLCVLSELECPTLLSGSFILDHFRLEPGERTDATGAPLDGYHLVPRSPNIGLAGNETFHHKPLHLDAGKVCDLGN